MEMSARNKLLRMLSGASGLLLAVIGLALSYDFYYLYFLEAKNPSYSPPIWESRAVTAVLVVVISVPLFAAYKLIRFAVRTKVE